MMTVEVWFVEFNVSCGVGVGSMWEVLWYDDTSARTSTAMSSIIRFTIIINNSMKVLISSIIISFINVIGLIVTIGKCNC